LATTRATAEGAHDAGSLSEALQELAAELVSERRRVLALERENERLRTALQAFPREDVERMRREMLEQHAPAT
jgi:galactokinase